MAIILLINWKNKSSTGFSKASLSFSLFANRDTATPAQGSSVWRGAGVGSQGRVQTGPGEHLGLPQGLPHRLRGGKAPRQEHGLHKVLLGAEDKRTGPAAARATQGSRVPWGHFWKAVMGT